MSNAIVGTRSVLRYAARRAMLAPSVHNTQPWRFVVTNDGLEIHRDPARQLGILDPRGRQLLISCGCALLHARVAVENSGHRPLVRRLPFPTRPEVVARVQVGEAHHYPTSAALDAAIDVRRSNRRAFMGDPVPAGLVRELSAVARAEKTVLVAIEKPQHRAAVARLTGLAEELERSDPAYLAELARWITNDPRRRDGVQAASLPHSLPGTSGGGLVRGFDVFGMGWLPHVAAAEGECLLLLCSHEDGPEEWLRAGEALARVWLTLTDRGYWASPLVQPVEVLATNDQLRDELGLVEAPQLLLRAGHAPAAAATKRRPYADVVVEPAD